MTRADAFLVLAILVVAAPAIAWGLGYAWGAMLTLMKGEDDEDPTDP